MILNDTFTTVFDSHNALESVLDVFYKWHCFAILHLNDELHFSQTMPSAAAGPIFQGHVNSEVGQRKSEWTAKTMPWIEEGPSLGAYLDACGERYRT